MKLFRYFILAVVCICANIAFAADTPTVNVTPPPEFKAKKFFLFPLEIPSAIFRIASLPVGATLNILEDHHVIKKTLDFLSNKEKTFWVYPIVEGGTGSGFGGGFGLRHIDLFHKGYLLAATYRIHIDMGQISSVSFGKPNAFELFGKPASYSLGASFQRKLNDNFYGIGNSSNQDDHSWFGDDYIRIGANVPYELFSGFTVAPHVGMQFTNSMNGSSSPANIVTSNFSSDVLTGFGKWLYYFEPGIRFIYDTRDNLEYTTLGGVRSFSYQYHRALNRDGYNYNQFDLDLREFIPLWRPRQVLILHAGFTFLNASGHNQVPFWQMAVLDSGSPLRGFQSGRFRDLSSMIFNAEYRYPLWKMIDGAIFYDTGRVFHSIQDMSLSKIKYSAGAGFSLRIPNLVQLHLYGGYGGEGINIMLGTSRPL